MKLRDATTADAARLDTLLTRLIHDEVQYDSNLNGSYVVFQGLLRLQIHRHVLFGFFEGEFLIKAQSGFVA